MRYRRHPPFTEPERELVSGCPSSSECVSHLTEISFASSADRFDRAAGGERIWTGPCAIAPRCRRCGRIGHCRRGRRAGRFGGLSGCRRRIASAVHGDEGVRLSRRALLVPVDRPARFGPRMRTRTDLDTVPRLAPFPSPLQPAVERSPARPFPSPNPLSGKKCGPLTNF